MTDLISRFRDCPILVVGDLMLDEFIWGHVNRISPEAPVPVVEVQERTYSAGGAANTAVNVGSLGGRVSVAGLVGEDVTGEKVCSLLAACGVDGSAVLRDCTRPTTTKTRVIAHSQQMVRIDQESPGPTLPAVQEQLLVAIQKQLLNVRGCVLSDYGKGVMTPEFTSRLIAAARAAGVPVVVDPKGTQYEKYRGATLIKPNQLEAGQVLNRVLKTNEDVLRAGADLLAMLGIGTSVLITRGSQGMSLFEHSRPVSHVPAQAREVYDVTGAGDTVAGTLILTLAAGGSMSDACRLASLAAAVVVGKVGTAPCTIEELRSALKSAQW
jgi:D-beta-D-heptose 7-phosphate kinase/D-beta-D-heptose 1-phosphate adenosyltransferase